MGVPVVIITPLDRPEPSLIAQEMDGPCDLVARRLVALASVIEPPARWFVVPDSDIHTAMREGERAS